MTEVKAPSNLTTIGEQAFSVRYATPSLSSIGAEALGAQTSELTLRGPAGYVAEEWARKNGIRFEAVDGGEKEAEEAKTE